MKRIIDLNKDAISIINKLDVIKHKTDNKELQQKLNNIIYDLYNNDGQLEQDRLIFNVWKFIPKNKEFIKRKWIQFLKENKNPFLSLYIHVPFCVNRCRFCEYYSTILENKNELDKYLKYLEDEIKYFAPVFSKNKFTNIYIGGGTPTLFENEQLEKLFKIIYNNFNIDKDGQHTLEISPYIINKKKIDIAKNYVNRISMGIQSLDKEVLIKNNRLYVSYEKLKELFNYIKSKNFQSFDVDFILGLDGDTPEKFIKGFEDLLKLEPNSITLYKLHYANDTPNIIREKYPPQKGNTNISKEYHFADYSMQNILNCVKSLIKKYNYYGNFSKQYKTPRFRKGKCPQIDSAEKWYLPYYNYNTHNSILGIGIGAESYITYELEYRNINNLKGNYNIQNTEYYVNKIEIKNQMRSYLVSTLISQYGIVEISINDFKKKFNKDIFKEFRDEIEILKRIGMLVKYKEKILLFPKNDHERVVATRLFGNS